MDERNRSVIGEVDVENNYAELIRNCYSEFDK